MKIGIVSGSPHKAGTSDLLIQEFTRGAQENGYEVSRYDVAHMNIHPCTACEHCHAEKTMGECVTKDDAPALAKELLEMDMIVFAAPIYYYGWCSQLKMAVDRWYAIDDKFYETTKKCCLLLTYGDDINPIIPAGGIGTYEGILHYYSWLDCGRVIAGGVITREDIEKTDFPQQAYQLGKSIH